MLKNIKLSILIGLIIPISTISSQPAARAATEFCNQTNAPVRVAYARGTLDPRPSIEIINYQIKGWLTIDPGACTTASTEPANKVDRPDGYDLVRHYYHTKFASSNLALTDETASKIEKFCIRDTDFQYASGIDPTSPKPKCERGYREVSFGTFYSNTPNYKIALTSQSDPSAQSKIKSFAQWCQEKDTLSVATARTIDVLLKQAKTQNCKSADSILGKLTELNIREGKISDLRPIAGLKNLTILNLDQNQIVDLAPLSNLSKLTTLSLSINKIVNVSPLANLSNLKSLNLMANNIRDVKSLAKLKKVTWLQLSENPIGYDPTIKKVCPIVPVSNCVWIYE
jgi:Leucine-rich repeat (LRR) protein